jgi:flagellin
MSGSAGTNDMTALNTVLDAFMSAPTRLGAHDLIADIDDAIDYVSRGRSRMGAQQNRIESAIASYQVQSENVAAARGRIVDADFAVETANLSRAQILQQAGMAMLAQANAMPQNVLSLLR